jgi:pre-mRNA-processing factor 19
MHSAGTPGILVVDAHAADTGKLVTGGSKKTVAVFNKDSDHQVVFILKGYTNRIALLTRVSFDDLMFE